MLDQLIATLEVGMVFPEVVVHQLLEVSFKAFPLVRDRLVHLVSSLVVSSLEVDQESLGLVDVLLEESSCLLWEGTFLVLEGILEEVASYLLDHLGLEGILFKMAFLYEVLVGNHQILLEQFDLKVGESNLSFV